MAQVVGAREHKSEIPLVTLHSVKDPLAACETLRLLLAEDNLVKQRLTTRLLEKRGDRVVLARLQKDSCDLVLMDIQMPEMNGMEATARIPEKEKLAGAHQPILALTAQAMEDDRELCLAGGMDGYLAKPIRAGADQILEQCAGPGDGDRQMKTKDLMLLPALASIFPVLGAP